MRPAGSKRRKPELRSLADAGPRLHPLRQLRPQPSLRTVAAFDDAARGAITECLTAAVAGGALTVLVNLALLGELAGLYFSRKDPKHERFHRAVRFVFEAGQGKVMLPLDHTGLQLRFGLEVAARGKASYESLLVTGRRDRWVVEAFLGSKRDPMHKLAAEARKRKDAFAQSSAPARRRPTRSSEPSAENGRTSSASGMPTRRR